ncbi:hypothetical protein LCGC14_2395260 [marine sediment metagenome]|uniref:6-pyruvoyl tetrahydrobiopterin synthase n=1 Tax=marine sediment metagenome TaxID=412755 RepID=A0A0F9ERE3_9ZZZZ
MYRVIVSTTFDAAHRLVDYQGPCARLHGHTWKVTGEWEREQLDRRGLSLDLVHLKKQLRSVVVDMDHNLLNRIRELAKPTAENIAQLLFKRLSKKIPSGEYLIAVTIEETPGCSVRYETLTLAGGRGRGGHMASMPEPVTETAAETDPTAVNESEEEPPAPVYEDENKDKDKEAKNAGT